MRYDRPTLATAGFLVLGLSCSSLKQPAQDTQTDGRTRRPRGNVAHQPKLRCSYGAHSEHERVLPAGELRRVVPRGFGDSDAPRRVRAHEPRPLSDPRLLRRLRGRRHTTDGREVFRTQAMSRARAGALSAESTGLPYRPRCLPGRRLHLHHWYATPLLCIHFIMICSVLCECSEA